MTLERVFADHKKKYQSMRQKLTRGLLNPGSMRNQEVQVEKGHQWEEMSGHMRAEPPVQEDGENQPATSRLERMKADGLA